MHGLVHDLWRRHGPTILIVTHDVDEAILLADRVLLLDNGRITRDVTIDLPRPRTLGGPGHAPLRHTLLAALGVHEEAQA